LFPTVEANCGSGNILEPTTKSVLSLLLQFGAPTLHFASQVLGALIVPAVLPNCPIPSVASMAYFPV
jgi:hypothetical protein